MAFLPGTVPDESAFTAGASPFTPIGGVFNDSAAALTSGQQGTGRQTPNRARHVNLRNQAGTEIATASNPLRTDPVGTTKQPVLLYDAAGNAITSTSSALDQNVKLLGGTAIDVNSGNKSAGTQRVVLATDQPALSTPLPSAPVVRFSSDAFKAPVVGNRTLLTAITNAATSTEVTVLTPPAYFFVTNVQFILQASLVGAAAGAIALLLYEGSNTASTIVAFAEFNVPSVAPTAGGGQYNYSFPCSYNSQSTGVALKFLCSIGSALTGTVWCLVSYGLTASTW